MIVNLAVNAIKFCGQPGLVQIWAENQPKDRQIVIGVTDNGDGIAPENLAVIFQRFKQVGANPARQHHGIRPGPQHREGAGAFELRADRGEKRASARRSTFWFSLPIADPQEVMTRYAHRIVQFQNGPHAVSLVAVDGYPLSSEEWMADDVNTFLNTLLRRHDLNFRTDCKEWLMAVSCDELELEGFFARVEETREKINRNRPAEPLPCIRLRPLGTWPVADRLEGLLAAANHALHLPVARLS